MPQVLALRLVDEMSGSSAPSAGAFSMSLDGTTTERYPLCGSI